MSYNSICGRFSCLVSFILLHKENLLAEPFRGNLHTIKSVFMLYSKDQDTNALQSFHDLGEFYQFLQEFNDICNNALVFGSGIVGKVLVWVNVAAVTILRDRFASLNSSGTPLLAKYKKNAVNKQLPVQKRLESILGLQLYSNVGSAEDDSEISVMPEMDYDGLSSMLSKPTAAVVLGIERAKRLSLKKPFYEVCEITSHNQALAKLCLNSKNFGQSVQDLPSNAKIHKVISSCKALITKDVANCIKTKVHFLPLVTSSTDLYLGNCSYLDTCHKMKSCRYLHYYTLNPPNEEHPKDAEGAMAFDYTIGECGGYKEELPPQWINCDVRYLPFNILGKFAAIISDPAWDIHMSLPYGTCKDSELLSLNMSELQEEGIILLWVTGRSIEIGRRALSQWGYTVSDEMVWIKLNQLRRTIVTGRTGHWLNHSKENLIVGIKGNPVWLNRQIDLDFMVSSTRETLRKPDELYGIVERIVGRHARKLEIFGRQHNIRPGWFSTYFNPQDSLLT